MSAGGYSLVEDRRRARGIRENLLLWYDGAKRDLPWRRSRDPYAIWLSETMLQQTRVDTVIPYYERFLQRFPSVYHLADSETDDVLGHWAGLGYYSRARNLQAAAKRVVDEFDGHLPDDAEDLRSLPGIGRYTAGAVASIAFDRPEPLVDGNVARVFARLLGIREDIKQSCTIDRLWQEAAALVRGPRPGDLNQAVMELGAVVCTPRAPRCDECPLRRRCAARRQGDAESLPIKSRGRPPLAISATAVWLRRRGQVLAVRRPVGGLMGGLWELPGGEFEGRTAPMRALRRSLHTRLGVEALGLQRVGRVEHLFSHRRLRLFVFRGECAPGRVSRTGFEAHRWVGPNTLASLPHGAATRKALALLNEGLAK